ncbi:ribonuclease HI [Robertkochia aurantiaca]|uniref:ribonuclease HI n=1 Tax=Robertkochia aurantiaca TaxID=2873700 RepID=UPI001CCBE7B0|nr:ribonuclease HI [Robertkochia sp. 3YJGBD-33]
MTKHDVYIYTDGSSRGNPGPGGYGIVMEWVGRGYRKEFAEGFQKTTNNRMELLAVIEALKKLKKNNLRVKVVSDSKYVVDAVKKGWVFNWERKGFKDRKNPDLWKDLLKEFRRHQVDFEWIKGHNNHPQNERCDQLAVEASKKTPLRRDEGYESQSLFE